MKLGFLTVSLGSLPLGEVVPWASEQGFQTLELGAWPVDNSRDFSSTTLDVTTLDASKAREFKDLFAKHGIEISSLAYYDNNLEADPAKRAANHEHLRKVIDAASLLGVELVGTFVGRNITKSMPENLEEFSKVFPSLIDYAESKNVRLMIENCPMPGWQEWGLPGNLFYSPELFREIFRVTPDSFGLNLDPSHLHWLGIDYLSVVEEFSDRIFHAHAKDTEILNDGLHDYGVFGSVKSTGHGQGWWRYRLPGLGEIDWQAFISKLQENGFDGVLSIEHEDPVWEGSEEKVKKGLTLGYRHLSPFIV